MDEIKCKDGECSVYYGANGTITENDITESKDFDVDFIIPSRKCGLMIYNYCPECGSQINHGELQTRYRKNKNEYNKMY